jgi:hypothetical protein
MRKFGIFAVFYLLLLMLTVASAQLMLTGVGPGSSGGSGAFSPSCTPSSNFLARTSGLTNGQKTAYDTMICTLNTSGDWANLDAFYMYVTNSTATLKLNLVSSSFTLTLNGAGCTFAAFGGYQGDASTCYQDTGFNPSTAGGHYTLNAAQMGVCDLTSRTTANANTWAMGAFDGTNVVGLLPYNTAGNVTWYMNATAAEATSGFSNVQGSWAIYRSAAGTVGDGIQLNGVFNNTGTATSSALPNVDVMIMTLGQASPLPNTSSDKFGYAWFGGITASFTNIYNAAHTFIAAVGGPAGC